MPTNDNDQNPAAQSPRTTDAHGQAALLLVESLIHGLIATSVLSTEQSLEIVTRAVQVQADYAADADDGDSRREMSRSQTLLSRIAESLETEVVSLPGSAAVATKPTLVDNNDRPFDDREPQVFPGKDDGSGE